jgi:multiple sugar transport system ATP-binding protein
MADVRLPEHLRGVADGGGAVIAGIRPEHFEDAALIGADKREHGCSFRARIEVLEALGSELYAHFPIGEAAVQSRDLEELAADAGTAEIPGGGEGRAVARLNPASRARQGQEAELWLDVSQIQLFGDDGRALARDRDVSRAPA